MTTTLEEAKVLGWDSVEQAETVRLEREMKKRQRCTTWILIDERELAISELKNSPCWTPWRGKEPETNLTVRLAVNRYIQNRGGFYENKPYMLYTYWVSGENWNNGDPKTCVLEKFRVSPTTKDDPYGRPIFRRYA